MKHSEPPVAVILAAGKGKRMKSDLPKVLQKLHGKPMVEYVINTAKELGVERIILVIGHRWEKAKKSLEHLNVEFVVQEQQLGTGHAVLQTRELLSNFEGDVLILCGDVPLLRPDTLKQLVNEHRERKAHATVLTAVFDDPAGYGRVIRGKSGLVQKIVEDKDATAEEREVREINTGTFCFDRASLFSVLENVRNDNKQGEYYLTDTFKLLLDQKRPIWAVVASDPSETVGINSEEELERAEEILRAR
ncbi:MAG: NTP transferase domain-containing protein [candidate division Zixibacteria bacterium]|nr:NTP transferase domain-containing protein [candidate division Zixibacteria bacterium]